jgi:hypothetical protein
MGSFIMGDSDHVSYAEASHHSQLYDYSSEEDSEDEEAEVPIRTRTRTSRTTCSFNDANGYITEDD